MLNDRDEKYEGHEEGEYHFSDEEVSYEVETDTEAESSKDTISSGGKANLLNNLPRSKRMLVSMGVFLVLVVVVFKMVAPSTSTIPTDAVIEPVVAVNKSPMTSASAPVIAVAPAPVQAPAPAPAPVQALAQIPAPAPVTPSSIISAPPIPTAPVTQAVSQSPSPIIQVAQPSAPVTQLPPQTVVAATNLAPTPMPAAAPNLTSSGMPVGEQQPTSPLPGVVAEAPLSSIDAKISNVAMDTEKLISQVQTDYSQKLNSYQTQNKALQDELQTLNSRVGSMETQLNQLVQALIRQNQGGASNNVNSAPAQVQPEFAEPKVSYNVQAIIPGRAWLKSGNGETITVAEGDSIKEFGRVTKIDPYDGVIEVNTGSKTVSLSYGNGA